jgi:hypothetical protein
MTDYTKHAVTTDALDTLGTIIGPDEKRDAIHLAVEPVYAAEDLQPGAHVKFDRDGDAMAADPESGVGIVDPFLTTIVSAGEWFWLVVYPRQITTLRHVWEHPSFPPSKETNLEGGVIKEWQPTIVAKVAAETWLKEYAEGVGIDFAMLINAATGNHVANGVADDDYVYTEHYGDSLHFGGQDAYGEIAPQFWEMLSVYTGVEYRASDNPSHFSCSC